MFEENDTLLCVKTGGPTKEEVLRGDVGAVLKDGRDGGGADEERQCRASTTSWHGPWR
jgi:hypothetical protein